MAMKRKNGNKSKKASFGNMLWKGVKVLAGPLVFVEQVSHNDREIMGDAFNSAPASQKGKILINILLGRTVGISPFADEVQAPQTINFSGIFNRWSGLGAGMKVYSLLARSIKVDNRTILPHASKIDSLGTSVLTSGVAGGVFSPSLGVQGGGIIAAAQTKHIKLTGTNNNQIQRSKIMNNVQSFSRVKSQPNVAVLQQEVTIPDMAMVSI